MKYRYREEHEMKDSGIEWLGMIPKEWERITLRRITTLKQGLQIDQKKRFIENGENRLPYITIKFLNSKNKNAEIEYIENADKGVICGIDDILMARTGSTGEVITNVIGVFHNNFFKVIYNKNKIVKEYFLYVLKERGLNTELLLKAGTTTIPDLNHGSFFNTETLLFSNVEQKKIAKFLDKKTVEFDEVIEKKEKLIEKLEETKKSLISEVVTGKKKVYIDESGQLKVENRPIEEMKDSGVEWLGMIPEECEVSKLKYFTTKITKGTTPTTLGKAFVDSGINFIKVESINKHFGFYKSSFSFIDEETNSIMQRSQLLEKDIVFSIAGAIGRVGVVTKSILPANTNQAVGIISMKKNYNSKYISYNLNSEMNKIFYNLYTVRTAQENLSLENLGNSLIIVRTFIEQQKIADFLDQKTNKFNSIIQKNKDQIEKIKEAKQSLISEAVTGKIEVITN